MRRPAPWLPLAALLLAPGAARGWNDEGHAVVAALAERRLGAPARAMVRELLGAGHLWDRDVAIWPDDHRDRATAPFHWVDIPFDAEGYLAERDCPEGRCAVARLAWAAETLRAAAEPERRLEALRWLVHLAGDLHQPLHATEGWRQGNLGGVRLPAHLGQRSYVGHLHLLWDAEVVGPALAGRSPLELAAALDRPLDAAERDGWAAELDPAGWATESNRLARAIYRELQVGPRQTARIEVPEAYLHAQRGRVEAALRRAGVRLAALLDRIAAARPHLP